MIRIYFRRTGVDSSRRSKWIVGLGYGDRKGENGEGLLERVEELGKVVYNVEYPIEYDQIGIWLYALESHTSGAAVGFLTLRTSFSDPVADKMIE
jgi:hypothetical protein